MSVYPPPRDIGPIFNPDAYLKAEFDQFLPLAGGTLSGSVNQRLGNFNLTGTGQAFNVLGGGSFRASNQVVLTQTALGTGVLTSNLQTVGTLNSLSVAGNVSVGSTLVASTLQAVNGIPDSQVLSQGAYQAWNSVGSGAVDFVNKFGSGSDSSFNFFASSGSASPLSTGKSFLGAFTPQGVKVGSRWAVVNPSQQTRMQYGYVVGTGPSSGSVAFSENFSSAPILVTQMINLITDRFFVVNVGSVTSSGFSWLKQYQLGSSTFGSGTEDFMWIALGA